MRHQHITIEVRKKKTLKKNMYQLIVINIISIILSLLAALRMRLYNVRNWCRVFFLLLHSGINYKRNRKTAAVCKCVFSVMPCDSVTRALASSIVSVTVFAKVIVKQIRYTCASAAAYEPTVRLSFVLNDMNPTRPTQCRAQSHIHRSYW